ncbi:hypothetical protein QN355_19745 [Cryobacterium sp. 10S3]|uniref:hypothetical protein n=1 Tax=Cryobacterium sp. 10S3 TaxID=3048582 RepID=UPI002B231291|nr:hypothetical protein [Cryobacterium sp. 10S3]MEB0288765.1 hypothetical protein [Cryobacterium sp. 10S3]
MSEVRRSRIVVKPSAWFWYITTIVSLLTLIVVAGFGVGTIVAFSGSLTLFVGGWWSVLYWLGIWLSIGAFNVSIVGSFVAKRREVRAGYTTVPMLFKHVEWRDHATGLVLRQPGEPTPLGPIKELRRAAMAAADVQ